MTQCIHIKDDGEQCGAQALKGADYCRHHVDSEKVVETTGKSFDAVEGKAIDVLEEEMERSSGPNARVRAAESILEHVRWREGRGE